MTCSVFFLRAKQSSVWPKCQGGSWNALGRRGGMGGGWGGDDVQLPPVPVRSLGWLVVCCLVAYLFFEDCGVCVPVSFARMPCQSMRSRSLLCVCDFFRALINSLCCRKAASFLQDLRAASVGVTLLSRAGSGAQLQRGLVGCVSCQVYFWCAKTHY